MLRLLLVFLLISSVSFAQKKKEEKKTKIELPTKQIIRDGNEFYNKADFAEAENQYSKALELNPNYEKANYNLGNAKYQQGKFEEAIPQYDLVTKTTEDKIVKAENFHNIGNAMMKQKQYDKAVEAYKNALRNNPNDDETRYNLALAQKLMKKDADNKEKDKNNKDKNNDKDKEKKDQKENDKDNKNDQNKDKKKEEGDKGDKDKDKKGDNKEDPNKDKQGESDKKKKQPQPQKNQLSKQQIQQLLEAMNNEENKTQKKVNAKKAKGRKIKQEKDW